MQNSDKWPNLIDSSDIISKKNFVAIKESGKTKDEISNFVGVNPETIRNWEKGKSSPNYTQLLKLMEVTGKGPQYFFDYENHNTQKEKQALEIKGELTIDSLLSIISISQNQITRYQGHIDKLATLAAQQQDIIQQLTAKM